MRFPISFFIWGKQRGRGQFYEAFFFWILYFSDNDIYKIQFFSVTFFVVFQKFCIHILCVFSFNSNSCHQMSIFTLSQGSCRHILFFVSVPFSKKRSTLFPRPFFFFFSLPHSRNKHSLRTSLSSFSTHTPFYKALTRTEHERRWEEGKFVKELGSIVWTWGKKRAKNQ